jgi:hypothetical protein
LTTRNKTQENSPNQVKSSQSQEKMSTHVISSIASNLVDSCCGDALASKLAFGKKNDIDDGKHDIDVTEEKKEDTPSAHSKVNPNNPGIKLFKKKQHFTDKEMKYYNVKWKHLPKEAREAAESVGYDQKKWDHGETIKHLDDEHWHDLHTSQKHAMETLGWDKHSWNDRFKDYGWKELPELQRRAATVAGYTKENWWDGPDHLKKLQWKDLTDDQKQAMAVFGWTEHEWDKP